MAVLEPRVALLDETDSGLDIDALKAVADGVNKLMNPNMAVVVITHYQRLLNYIKPHFVHIMSNGRIIKTGGPELALELEEQRLRLDHWTTRSQRRFRHHGRAESDAGAGSSATINMDFMTPRTTISSRAGV